LFVPAHIVIIIAAASSDNRLHLERYESGINSRVIEKWKTHYEY